MICAVGGELRSLCPTIFLEISTAHTVNIRDELQHDHLNLIFCGEI